MQSGTARTQHVVTVKSKSRQAQGALSLHLVKRTSRQDLIEELVLACGRIDHQSVGEVGAQRGRHTLGAIRYLQIEDARDAIKSEVECTGRFKSEQRIRLITHRPPKGCDHAGAIE